MKTPAILVTVRDHDLNGHFNRMIGAPRQSWPIRFGLPFPRGRIREPGRLVLRDGGKTVPHQAQVTSRWPDGSLRWVSVLALVDLAVSETKDLRLTIEARENKASQPLCQGAEAADGFSLANESLKLDVARSLDAFRLQWRGETVAAHPPSIELEMADGARFHPRWETARLEAGGPLARQVVWTGYYVNAGGDRTFDVELGLELTAGQSWLEFFHRLVHRVPGQPVLPVRRLAIRQAWELHDPRCVVRQSHRGTEWLPRDVVAAGRVEISVTEKRASVTDLAMVGETIEDYPPYLKKGLDSVEPWLALKDDRRVVLFWTPEPVGRSPQKWIFDGSAVVAEFIPGGGEPAEFTQGRAMTHRWRWQLAPPPSDDTPDPGPTHCFDSPYEQLALRHTLQPLVSVAPAWIRRCRAADVHRTLAYAPARFPRVEGFVSHRFELPWPAGMMNWGDDADPGYTQNYAASGLKAAGAVWTNNEYDFIHAVISQMLRTGQGRFWRIMERSARHALDVDFVHYSDDPWLNQGSPAHCVKHTTAASYPSHIWAEGLLHYYYLTGDERALATARCSGEFILRYQRERWWVFEETAREAGWALLALTELFAATGEKSFRDGARRIRDFVLAASAGAKPLFPGEASFFIGVLAMGLDKLHDWDPDPRIPAAIGRIVGWRLDRRLSPEGIPLYHWDAAARMVNTREIMFPAALAIAHRHTRQKRFLEALWRCLQYWVDTHTFYGAPLCTKGAAAFYRTWIEAFGILARAGLLGRLEYSRAAGNRKNNP